MLNFFFSQFFIAHYDSAQNFFFFFRSFSMFYLRAISKFRSPSFQLPVKILSPRPWVTEKLKRPPRHHNACLGFMLRIVKVMFPRPKSCYKRSGGIAGEPKIRQRSVDLTTGTPSTVSSRFSTAGPPDAAMLLSKRSNSLQNLSTVRCKERKVDFRQPVKLAWVPRAHSQDSDFESQFTTTNDQLEDVAGEWCDTRGSYSTRQKQQKRKSLDIFLARSFIDPADLRPTSWDVSRRQKLLVKPFASLSEGNTMVYKFLSLSIITIRESTLLIKPFSSINNY